MKRYKLIKDYLGCDYKLGTVIDTTFIWVNNKKVFLENYPENWREVVEKDYEILSYRSKDKIIAPATNFLIKISKPGHWNIHSVKRLSDGEIFTVGDMVSIKPFNNSGYFVNTLTIRKSDNSVYVRAETEDGMLGFGKELSDINHSKEPLFTTEDGVDIFKGSKYFTVYTMEDDKGVYETWKTQCHPFSAYGEPEHFIHKDVVYFSTKEAAEEYILMNKPCLSLKDIADHFGPKGEMELTNDTTRRFFRFLKSWTKENKL